MILACFCIWFLTSFLWNFIGQLVLIDLQKPVECPPLFRRLFMPTAILKNSIRRLRFDNGMTQEELALRTGVSRQTVMSIERGQTVPSVLLAFKISAAFNAPIEDVFQMEGSLVPV